MKKPLRSERELTSLHNRIAECGTAFDIEVCSKEEMNEALFYAEELYYFVQKSTSVDLGNWLNSILPESSSVMMVYAERVTFDKKSCLSQEVEP